MLVNRSPDESVEADDKSIASLAHGGRSTVSVESPPHQPPAELAHASAAKPHHRPSAKPEPDDHAGAMGTSLEPVLRQECGGRLSEINWFRTDWQRGGALTGYAHYVNDDGQPQPVVVKLPVPPRERHWLKVLQPHDPVAPRLYAHGETLNGYDLAWVVMERLPHGPLGATWAGAEFDLLVEAAGRFYAAAHHLPATGESASRDWERICQLAREKARNRQLPHMQRWQTVLKKAQRKLHKWLKIWNDRPQQDWCHGDLHLGNAMTRTPAPHGPALLFDFAHTHVGHWVEDAVYFEHLFWARRDRLRGRRLCRLIAQERKRHHLPVDSEWPQLAQIKRNLLAMSTPAQLCHHGDPQQLRAALDVLEAAV